MRNLPQNKLYWQATTRFDKPNKRRKEWNLTEIFVEFLEVETFENDEKFTKDDVFDKRRLGLESQNERSIIYVLLIFPSESKSRNASKWWEIYW